MNLIFRYRSHLGSMYIGMQHLQQSNVLLAQKYFTGCLAICDTDPVLLNEVAVMHFNLTEYDEALDFLNRALKKLEFTQRKNIIWETAWLNLAHTYRKLGYVTAFLRFVLVAMKPMLVSSAMLFSNLNNLKFLHPKETTTRPKSTF